MVDGGKVGLDVVPNFGGFGNLLEGGVRQNFAKLKSLGNEAGQLFGGGLKGAVSLGVAGIGVALADLAIKGVTAFADVTAEVRKFQRGTGESAESASKWVFAAHQMGIETDLLSTGMVRFGRNISEHTDKFDKWGVAIARNKDGTASLTGTLLNISDAFRTMHDPAERDAMVMDLLGKQGAALIPILQRGRAGLQELFAQAEKHGLVFNNEELERGRQFSLATKEMGQAFKGMEISLGEKIVPLLTDAAHFASAIADEMNAKKQSGGAFQDIGHFLGVAGEQFDSLFPKIEAGEGLVGQLGESLGFLSKKSHDAALGAQEQSTAEEEQAQAARKAEAASQEEAVGVALVTSARQSAAQSALEHMVATGRLTAEQLSLNLAIHHTKEGSVDYAGALKDLDPAVAKQAELQGQLDAGLGDVRDGFDRAKDAADVFKNAIDRALGVVISADEAAIRQAEAEDRLAKALADSAGSMDIKTEKGRTARQAFDDLLKSDEALIDANVRDANGNINAAVAKDQLIAKLREEEERYPGLRGQIDAYIGIIAAIPPDKLFVANVQDQPAAGQVDAFHREIDAIPLRHDTVLNAEIRGQDGVRGLLGMLQQVLAFDGKTVSMSVGTHGVAAIAPGLPPGSAAGSYQSATPGGRIIRVAEGGADEAVITRADPMGGAALFAKLYGIPAFASGGMVNGRSGGSSAPVGPMVIHNHLYIDGQEVATATAPHGPAADRTYRRSRQ